MAGVAIVLFFDRVRFENPRGRAPREIKDFMEAFVKTVVEPAFKEEFGEAFDYAMVDARYDSDPWDVDLPNECDKLREIYAEEYVKCENCIHRIDCIVSPHRSK